MRKKTIYIPIEIKARELYSQILLASKVAERGGRVYIGSKKGIFDILKEKREKNGVLLYKGGMGGNGFKRLRARVDAIAVLDQELGPANNDNNLITGRISSEDLKYVDRLYFLGKQFADYMCQNNAEEIKNKVKASGWPRVDLWTERYRCLWEYQADSIFKRYGDFILFSSDFGALAPEDVGWRVDRAMVEEADETDSASLGSVERYWDNVISEFKEVVEFLRKIDSDERVPPVVVRPHHGEVHERWLKALSGLKKTHVVYEGDISAWVQACCALLHRGCTTAYQAKVMDKPLGAIQVPSSNRDVSSVSFSKNVASPEDVICLLNSDFAGEGKDWPDDLFENENGTASEVIARDLLNLASSAEREYTRTKGPGLVRNAAISLARSLLREVFKKPANWTSQIPESVKNKKIPDGIHAQEANEVIEKLNFIDINASDVINNVICIDK